MEEMITNDVAIVVFTFDGYSDIWGIFFTLLKKNWIDLPFHIYTTGKTDEIKYENITYIETQMSMNWTQRLNDTLTNIHEKYVILLLEDFFIASKVNNNLVIDVIKYIKSHNIMYYKFKLPDFSLAYGKEIRIDKHRFKIDKMRKYGISIQPSIWNKKYLKSLIEKIDLNAWEFERYLNDIKPIDDKEEITHVFDNRNLFNIEHALIKGRFTRKGYKLIKNEKLIKKDNYRKKLSILDSFKIKTKTIIRFVIKKIT